MPTPGSSSLAAGHSSRASVSSEAQFARGADGDKLWSVARWQGLVSNSVRQMQKKGWRGKERLSRAGGLGAASLQTRIEQAALDLLAALWIVEAEPAQPKPHAYELDGEDVKPPLGPGGIPPGTPGVRSAGLLPGARVRQPQVLSRTGYVVLVLLFFLGIREMVSFSASSSSSGRRRAIDHNSIKIGHGRDPFAVLRDFAPPTMRTAAMRLPGVDRTWKSGLEAVDPDVEQEQGDTTAIVLHWKRTDNVEVVVANLCAYAFFRHVTVWNNNPDIFLTREVSAHRCPIALSF